MEEAVQKDLESGWLRALFHCPFTLGCITDVTAGAIDLALSQPK